MNVGSPFPVTTCSILCAANFANTDSIIDLFDLALNLKITPGIGKGVVGKYASGIGYDSEPESVIFFPMAVA
jgi:hypothetical protein